MPNIKHEAVVLSSPEGLKQWLKNTPRPLVFTNGCFDILHRGHISYLQDAAKFGASMLVALNTDASVKRLAKSGLPRPINPLEDRMAVLSALGCVSAVCSFDEDTPLDLIKICQPNVLVKGGDWKIDAIVGCQEVQSWDGKCHSIEFKFERSTTALIERIRG